MDAEQQNTQPDAQSQFTKVSSVREQSQGTVATEDNLPVRQYLDKAVVPIMI